MPADYWFFTGTANYNNIGNTTISDCIAKATATVVVDAVHLSSTTYTGLRTRRRSCRSPV